MQITAIFKPSYIVGYLKFIRGINLFMVALTQYLTAIFLVGKRDTWTQVLTDKGFFLLVSATVMITAAGYLINDYYDVKIDFVNKPDRVVVGKKLKRRWVLAGHTALNFVAIGIGTFLSWPIGATMFGASFLLWLYSNQLKRLPLVGNLAVAALTGMTLVLVAEYFQERTFIIACYAVFASFITLIREIIKDVEDRKGDERFGCRTIPIVYGVAKTKIFLFVIMGIFIITVFILLRNISFVLPSVLLLTLIALGYGIAKADTVRAFHNLSTYCKIIMLLGVLSMIWI